MEWLLVHGGIQPDARSVYEAPAVERARVDRSGAAPQHDVHGLFHFAGDAQ
jgi:hypothetical protein